MPDQQSPPHLLAALDGADRQPAVAIASRVALTTRALGSRPATAATRPESSRLGRPLRRTDGAAAVAS